tara:strand:+ start:1251 stop:1787 length:537 start_codon:yes stop_codon:yes gene_type:complete
VDQQNLERLPKRWDLEEVCNRIAAGESLAQIAQSYAKSKQALWKFLNTDESRRKRYLESLEARGILHLEAIERIARDVETGELDARAGAVAFQARSWVAGRLNPKMLSEKWRAQLEVPSPSLAFLAAIKETSEGQMDPTQSPVDDTHAQNSDDANQVIKNNTADTCAAITRSIDAEQD